MTPTDGVHGGPELDAAHLFPDANPNPVMRIGPDGRLVYANASSATLATAMGVELGQPVPGELLRALRARAEDRSLGGLEVECPGAHQTFLVTAVAVPELGALNLYGTDITGAKVVERFPDRNPNPVLRIDAEARLIYANAASQPIVRGLGLVIGQRLPEDLDDRIGRAKAGAEGPVEVSVDGRIFLIQPVEVPEFGFTNLYGTDVTAVKAVDRFPNLNPNPVLRISRDGRLQYANPASEPVRAALGVSVGDLLPEDLLERVRAVATKGGSEVIEVSAGARLYELLVASVYEFQSINLYGTDVTARRMVERANAENERLLLNILPAPIAFRLRQGERVIADRFDEITVLFADVVEFTPLAARLPAAAVVDLLNRVFSAFDALADRHGLEKIKTIGDAYMVVGGLTAGDDDAPRVADMGLEMIEAVTAVGRDVGQHLRVRIGFHVGPAVAGVIGIKRFIYDVWGDTVNTASRMESHGVPGRVQVTAATAERLSATHRFERRGTVDVKGKGQIEAWLLVGAIGAPEPGRSTDRRQAPRRVS